MILTFTGSDVQLLNEFPKQLSPKSFPYVMGLRYAARLAAKYSEEVWVVHSHLIPELVKFGIKESKISVHEPPIKHFTKYLKLKHEGFNILYYWHKGEEENWCKWIYGYEIFLKVKEYFRLVEDINFIEANSSSQLDLKEIYPITDLYLRPNNHDGCPRMVLECRIQSIPYYWTWENPKFEDIVQFIKEEYESAM
jgi:hypothetical protein